MSLKSVLLAAALCAGAAQAKDLGPTNAGQKIDVSLYLNVRNQADLARFIAATTTPGNAQYRQFLTTDQFAARYGATDADIAGIIGFLQQFGIATKEVYADKLVLSTEGTAAQYGIVFGASLEDFTDGTRSWRQASNVTLPAQWKGIVAGVRGLDTKHQFHDHHRAGAVGPAAIPAAGGATGVPGEFTTGDVSKLYNVNPLYAKGLDGSGMTLGIATLADFDPNDALKYWFAIGLKENDGRIHRIAVDGGGSTGPQFGSDETTLDVEQSGGMAPGANILVYHAPNTDQAFFDMFYKVASDNLVDTCSVSWGESEIFSLVNDGGSSLEIQHGAFMEMAAQGITMFASSGDDGAYDTTSALGSFFNPVLSVDSPSSDPYVVSSGGVTVPWSGTFSDGMHIDETQTRVWGWDYLTALFADFGLDAFSGGGGGGVSSHFAIPAWQKGIKGMRTTEPGQSLTDIQGNDYIDLPANFAGRNSPDISLNADPFSGYILYYSGDKSGFTQGWGGTSFVAPQLNGIASVIAQATGRIGALNPQLYRIAGGNAFHDITAGNNWFYDGVNGYDPGAGLGTIDATNLAAALMH